MIVFAGPSIAGLDTNATIGLDVRDPVQQGDVYLASLEKPAAIGIIDGYFEGVPSVWHKEILWAMKQGIAVLGAASMGALRAAELGPYGMIGVGAVYGAYATGEIEEDDDVALLHGPRDMGYTALTLAMVNVRASLAAAFDANVVSGQQLEALNAMAKSLFYKSRTWDAVFAHVDQHVMSTAQLQTLRNWLKDNEIDQKQADAAQLLSRMQAGDFAPPEAEYHFEQTALWQDATGIWLDRRAAQSGYEYGEILFADKELLGG